MSRKLYATSKKLASGTRLIGILTENNGEYRFEYKLDGKVQKWFLVIKEFPDVTQVYTGEVVKKFVDCFVPERDHWGIDDYLEQAGLSEYDEWELLKFLGPRGIRSGNFFLHESLPEGVIVFEKLETPET